MSSARNLWRSRLLDFCYFRIPLEINSSMCWLESGSCLLNFLHHHRCLPSTYESLLLWNISSLSWGWKENKPKNPIDSSTWLKSRNSLLSFSTPFDDTRNISRAHVFALVIDNSHFLNFIFFQERDFIRTAKFVDSKRNSKLKLVQPFPLEKRQDLKPSCASRAQVHDFVY